MGCQRIIGAQAGHRALPRAPTGRARSLTRSHSPANKRVSANIGNIRAQDCWGQSEHECRAAKLIHQLHQLRLRKNPTAP